MVSSQLQKQHFLSPFHFLLIKLSFVRINPFLRYHKKKILIFSGTLNFQATQLAGTLFSCMRLVYIDLTGNPELWFIFQTNWSSVSPNFTWATREIRTFHRPSLSPIKVLLKAMFKGILENIEATVWFLFLTILYNPGNCFIRGSCPTYQSSQILHVFHF